MLNEFERQLFQEELDLLVNDIIMRSQKCQEGIYWLTIDGITNENAPNPYLYEGVAGNIYFLLKSLPVTSVNTKVVLHTIHNAIRWLLHQKIYASGYYTGWSGIASLLIQCSIELNEPKYLSAAKDILLSLDIHHTVNIRNELLSGIAGILIPYIQFLKLTGDQDIIKIFSTLINQIIFNIKFGECGIFWDVSSLHNRALCGFSHGAAGIAHILLQLGNLCSLPIIKSLAIQAFNYENHFFEKSINSWPDFRQGIYDKHENWVEFKKNFSSQTISFFYQKRFMDAWCHGAIGIGISRLQAFKQEKDERFLKDIDKCVKQARKLAINNDVQSFTICHGKGGAAVFLLMHAHIMNNKESMQLAYQIVNNAIHQKKTIGYWISGQPSVLIKNDHSLLNGSCGIGCLIIDILQENRNASSIFTPDLLDFPERYNLNGLFEDTAIREIILKKFFPTSFNNKKIVDIFHRISFDHKYIKKNISSSIRPYILKKQEHAIEYMLFTYQQMISFTYLDIWNKAFPIESIQKQRISANSTLICPHGIKVVKLIDQNFVLKYQLHKLNCFPANQIIIDILHFYKKPATINKLIAHFQLGQHEENLKLLLLQQIKELLSAGILIKYSEKRLTKSSRKVVK